ncbi:MAG: hypothetical protein US22_C0004G0002 [candidate division TM6 bacterium GW2011_GWF2_36_6]|nr:MAG: hypothetical protein US22_C0004G0002 [candidate division TM6 bacterium GW2011_GWF2_36_6]
MIEQWIKWEPIKELSSTYYVDLVIDSKKEFKIILSEEKNPQKKIHIIFENSVYAYRNTYESFRQNTIHILKKQYGESFYINWTFFKITNSSYLSWLAEESYGITNELNFTHFSIIAANEIIDIIAGYEPRIELV